MRRGIPVLLAALLAAAGAAGQGDQVDELIRTLRPSPLDHAAWAEKLLRAADGLAKTPGAQRRLYGAAYDHGLRKAKGYQAAIRAARAILASGPKDRLAWQQRLLAALKLDWQAAGRERKREAGSAYVDQLVLVGDELAEAGKASEAGELYTEASYKARSYAPARRDEIARKLKDVRQRQQLVRQAAGQERLVAANPKNLVLREKLIGLYVVELDRPAAARKLLTPDVSEDLRTYVPLAAAEVGEVARERCAELGRWYHSLAGSAATQRGKANALARAQAYWERLVKLETDPIRGAIAKAKLVEVQKELVAANWGPLRGRLTLAIGKGVMMTLVLVPSGKFVMGSPMGESRRDRDEGPQHAVTITKPFYIGATEVTQGQYEAVTGESPSHFRGAQLPAEKVSWAAATAFCKKLSAKIGRPIRLPTEAEWEYACRAGSRGQFCFGDDEERLDDYAWHKANSDARTHAVAQKKPNAWGLYDMHGNVAEWCGDWYADQAYAAGANAVDPAGPASGSVRVLRGGSFPVSAQPCRSADRDYVVPVVTASTIGFRVVLPAGGRRTPR